MSDESLFALVQRLWLPDDDEEATNKALVLGRIRQAEQIKDELAEALRELQEAVDDKLGTMDFYFGPNSRSLSSRESQEAYTRIYRASVAALIALTPTQAGQKEAGDG